LAFQPEEGKPKTVPGVLRRDRIQTTLNLVQILTAAKLTQHSGCKGSNPHEDGMGSNAIQQVGWVGIVTVGSIQS